MPIYAKIRFKLHAVLIEKTGTKIKDTAGYPPHQEFSTHEN